MATWDDVACLALALPRTSERVSRGLRQWRVADKLFVWERPLRREEIEALSSRAPESPILAARVEHLLAKEALLADDRRLYFTTPHCDGYPAVLARLDRLSRLALEELVTEAWLVRAPKAAVQLYLAQSG